MSLLPLDVGEKVYQSIVDAIVIVAENSSCSLELIYEQKRRERKREGQKESMREEE